MRSKPTILSYMVEISRRVVVPIHSSPFTSKYNLWCLTKTVTEVTDDAEGDGEEVQGGVVELGGVDRNDNRGVILLASDDGEFAQISWVTTTFCICSMMTWENSRSCFCSMLVLGRRPWWLVKQNLGRKLLIISMFQGYMKLNAMTLGHHVILGHWGN